MRLIRTWQHAVLFAIVTVLWASSSAVLFAKGLPCNTIIGLEETIEISDCINPFGVEGGAPFELMVDGIKVMENDTVFIAALGTSDYHALSRNFTFGFNDRFYRHEGDNYRQVPSNYLPISKPEYQTYALAYFGEINALVDLYIEYLLGNSVDTDRPGWDFAEFNAFEAYVNSVHVYHRPTLLSGTYSLVVEEIIISVSKTETEDWLDTIRNFFTKTAQAQSADNPLTRKYALTFTLAEETPLPVGASSVLFLPGIQASRLYKDGLLGTEDQLWEPSIFGGDVGQLELDLSGFSVNEIYTRDVIDTAVGVGSIYGGFLGFLEKEKVDKQIKDFHAFAYDWRFDVYDLVISGTKYETTVESVIEAVEDLAVDSYTGKVSIVAHSNGGLLAKALMTELKSQGLSELVDKVVLVGVPQLGTPKALASLLHGYDQGDDLGGIVMSAQKVREIMNNMSGAYGLLPSEQYFAEVDQELITFDNGSSTAAYIEKYGLKIAGFTAYKNFLIGADNLDRDIDNSTAIPTRANETLLLNAFDKHKSYYDSWVAPAHVEVFEVIGYGLPTLAALEYRTLVETKCFSTGQAPMVCVDENILKPFAVSAFQGDGTVLAVSAEAYKGDKEVYYLDLFKINDQNIQDGKDMTTHVNLLDSVTAQDLLHGLMIGTTSSSYLYVSQTAPESTVDYDIHAIDSPVALWAIDREGNKTGAYWNEGVKIITEEIPGSQYYEIGDTKYLSIPSDTDYTIELLGEDYGGYTLTISTLAEDGQQILYQINNASTTPAMVARYTKEGEGYSPIEVDLNGDDFFEMQINILTGEVIHKKINIIGQVQKKPGTGTRVKYDGLARPGAQSLTGSVVEADNRVLAQALINILIEYRDILIRLTNIKYEHIK